MRRKRVGGKAKRICRLCRWKNGPQIRWEHPLGGGGGVRIRTKKRWNLQKAHSVHDIFAQIAMVFLKRRKRQCTAPKLTNKHQMVFPEGNRHGNGHGQIGNEAEETILRGTDEQMKQGGGGWRLIAIYTTIKKQRIPWGLKKQIKIQKNGNNAKPFLIL